MLLSILSILSFVYICEASFSIDSVLKNIRCHEDFCDSVKCEKLTDCPNGHIIPKTSYCNCCDACIPAIEEGRECDIPLEGSLKDIKKPRWCKNGLKCIDGKCAKDALLCIKEREFRKMLRSRGIFAADLWIPECDEAGNYLPKQTKKKRSMCVNTAGKRIFGQQEPGSSINMTCGCSRYMEELRSTASFMTEPQVHCSASGDYDEVQCIGDLCYCADSKTGKPKGRIVKMKYLDELPCREDGPHVKEYLKPCELEMIRNRKLVYDFRKKGIHIYLKDMVKCDPDGTFGPVQCDSTVCVCTNTAGVGIKSYSIAIENLDTLTTLNTLSCSCARDAIVHGSFPELNCKGFGSNMPLHCFNDEACFCVDEDGDLISEERNKSAISEPMCVEALQTLRDLQERTTTSTTQETTSITQQTIDVTDDYDYYD